MLFRTIFFLKLYKTYLTSIHILQLHTLHLYTSIYSARLQSEIFRFVIKCPRQSVKAQIDNTTLTWYCSCTISHDTLLWARAIQRFSKLSFCARERSHSDKGFRDFLKKRFNGTHPGNITLLSSSPQTLHLSYTIFNRLKHWIVIYKLLK